MSFETHIVAATYLEKPMLDFEDIVDEFELSVRGANTGRRTLTFDYDDIVIIDIEQLRIGLAWVEPDQSDGPYSLIVGTGAAPEDEAHTVSPAFCARLSEKILARLKRELPFDAVTRATLPQALDSDLLDGVAARLHAAEPEAEPEAAAETRPTAASLEPSANRDGIAASVAASPLPDNALPDSPLPEPSPPGAAQGSASEPASGLNRLRDAYEPADQPDRDAPAGAAFRTVLTGTQSVIARLSRRAGQLWPSTSDPDDPYRRLTRNEALERYSGAKRYLPRFGKSEYELYGKLLD
ncbi:hypothetical protein [Marimonas arenosa]|uniref:Uncharacterized protein n=1 Tax=Marimonas arenosa TaxID=1795305 RepID=A0AAE4B459_9RHOB|nr:hypothetical protein [Marimonas arenosa]MDQ2089074.1 hypothetical protein [Marimonas arenosa]